MLILTILSVIAFAILFFTICSEQYDNKDRSGLLFLYTIVTILCLIFSAALMSNNEDKQPTALDVYRGKTELKVKQTIINDSIVEQTDSIVIFKKL